MFTMMRARLDKAPHRFDKLWSAGALYCGESLTKVPGFKLLEVNGNNGRVGEQVALLEKAGFQYYYTVLRGYRAPGDDHCISPWSFDFLYHHKEPL